MFASLRRLAVTVSLVSACLVTALVTSSAAATPRTAASPILTLSHTCSASSAEVDQAVDPLHGDVYEAWIGCAQEGIAFVRSTNGGATFSAPVILQGSVDVFSWDPAATVGPDGTLYVSFMVKVGDQSYPIVDISHDHGATFSTVTRLVPKQHGNWGDRDFVAAGPSGTVYVTWDYGPSASKVHFLCPPAGSCSFSTGDLNIVVQKSTDGGKHFGPMVHVSPGYPAGGADIGRIDVTPAGRVDVVFQALAVTNKTTDALGPGHLFFTSSKDGGASWSKPVELGPKAGSVSVHTWWIDGDLAVDAGGTLYASWDTQGKAGDVGWLTWSSDGGTHWSAARRVVKVPEKDALIVQVTGGTAGHADVGWLGDQSPKGYELWVRPFTTGAGGTWLGPATLASGSVDGRSTVWPGDTFGLSAVPPAGSSAQHQLDVGWGSSVSHTSAARDDIFATRLSLP